MSSPKLKKRKMNDEENKNTENITEDNTQNHITNGTINSTVNCTINNSENSTRDNNTENNIGESISNSTKTGTGSNDSSKSELPSDPLDFRFSDEPSLEKIRQLQAAFCKERDWDQYHTPRNILLALVGEVGEVSEIFQWKGEVPVGLPGFSNKEKAHLAQELSDVLVYLVRLAHICHIDLPSAVIEKLQLNKEKYPVELVYGKSKKYNEYQENENITEDNAQNHITNGTINSTVNCTINNSENSTKNNNTENNIGESTSNSKKAGTANSDSSKSELPSDPLDFRFSDEPSLEKIRQLQAAFCKERDWDQYHTPRNILLALVGEVGEVSEIFQWKGEVPVGLPGFSNKDKAHLAQELSDVLFYLVRLAHICHIDLPSAVIEKLQLNKEKYPVELVYGKSKKYNEYQENDTTQK
ncbi:unnamed protein product [Owenia fusiformis]|uniref:Uncharacterized protein n=1 Tax=Owenia fusiformis TaxID=6347 RepID=A0A8S4Q8B0_OWEFU|nr:unnamed protein product [Owenia fusiformis]